MGKTKHSRVDMPPGAGGLIRYYDEESVGIEMRPEIVIGMIGVVIAIEAYLHLVL